MCAIFGIIGENNSQLIHKMSKVQEFRGPDKQNFYFDQENNVNLGNNRLSVIDINNGHQPMESYNKEFIIVFNGTIFNHKELKSYLVNKGIKFKTNSDTEVFINGYAYWNEEVFNFIDGMWAVAIYDKKKKEVVISRDYLGQKPLFYEIQKSKILFSSQISGILQDKSFQRQINYDGVQKFHFSSFLHAPHTLYHSIKQLEPAEIIKIDLKKVDIKKRIFWNLNNGPDYNLFFKAKHENFDLEFNNIIKNYSISDIKPAGLLSSGLDSFLVNKYITKNDSSFKTFTLAFKNKSFDEVKNFNKEFDIFNKNISFFNENEILEDTKFILKNLDHLCGDSSIIPTYNLIKKIKEIKKNTKVLISGDGGDEAFLGYIVFKALYGAKKIQLIPNFILNLIKSITEYLPVNYSYLSNSFKIKKFFQNINSDILNLTPLWMSPLKINDYNELFENKFSEEFLCKDFNNLSNNYLKNAQLYFYNFYLPYSVLFKTDFASMLNSVEYRSPLLSKNVINLSLNQKVENLFSLRKKKKLMLEIFKKQIPSSLSKIPKHGFAFPKDIVINQKYIENFVIDKNLINKKFFYKKLKNYFSKKEDCGQYLWNEIIYTNVINNSNNEKIK
jgi:asparagine synthase (glutamine-hydrolysing)